MAKPRVAPGVLPIRLAFVNPSFCDHHQHHGPDPDYVTRMRMYARCVTSGAMFADGRAIEKARDGLEDRRAKLTLAWSRE